MLGLSANIEADMTEGLGVVALVNGPGEPWALTTYALAALGAAAGFPYFEIVVRKGRLIAITGLGGETYYGETALTPLSSGVFRVGEEPTPEVLRFEAVASGRALSAVWSGHRFYLFER